MRPRRISSRSEKMTASVKSVEEYSDRQVFRALLLGKLMLYQLSYSRTVTYASRH